MNKPGLYVHIPFCSSICSYCGFIKLFYNSTLVNKYLMSLQEELKKYSSFSFDSIYIGGGTPTSLNEAQLIELFEMLKPYQNNNSIITIETNPDLSDSKIKILKKYNVSRISIGVQTFNEDYLKLINRDSNYIQVKNLINSLKENCINDINVDLIYGFKDQTTEILDKDLDLFLSLNITHISTYALQVEEMTILHNKNYEICSDEVASNLYHRIVSRLEEKGFFRYEVSNFAKKGFESKHNLIYWNNEEYGSVGLASSSYIDNVRRTNTKSLTEYLKGNYENYVEVLNEEDKEFYFIMLGLRKTEGILLSEYENIFKKKFLEKYQDKIENLQKQDLIITDGKYLRITENNFFIMDYILKKILF